jgi:hypothetical protein
VIQAVSWRADGSGVGTGACSLAAGLDEEPLQGAWAAAVAAAADLCIEDAGVGDSVTAGGSGTRRITRSSVIRLTGTANRPVSRAPARPPNAIATDSTTCSAGRV